ncbi:hypothetical protein Tco_0185123 [Tanacetum coccineum]
MNLDSLNSAAVRTWDKMPRECLKIIESKSKDSSIHELGSLVCQEAFALRQKTKLWLQAPNTMDQPFTHPITSSSCPSTCQKQLRQARLAVPNIQPRSGTLPGNTVTNPREDLKGITTRSGVAYQGPPIPTSSVVKPIPEVTKDQVHPSCSQSTAPVQPPVGPEPITTPVP